MLRGIYEWQIPSAPQNGPFMSWPFGSKGEKALSVRSSWIASFEWKVESDTRSNICLITRAAICDTWHSQANCPTWMSPGVERMGAWLNAIYMAAGSPSNHSWSAIGKQSEASTSSVHSIVSPFCKLINLSMFMIAHQVHLVCSAATLLGLMSLCHGLWWSFIRRAILMHIAIDIYAWVCWPWPISKKVRKSLQCRSVLEKDLLPAQNDWPNSVLWRKAILSPQLSLRKAFVKVDAYRGIREQIHHGDLQKDGIVFQETWVKRESGFSCGRLGRIQMTYVWCYLPIQGFAVL